MYTLTLGSGSIYEFSTNYPCNVDDAEFDDVPCEILGDNFQSLLPKQSIKNLPKAIRQNQILFDSAIEALVNHLERLNKSLIGNDGSVGSPPSSLSPSSSNKLHIKQNAREITKSNYYNYRHFACLNKPHAQFDFKIPLEFPSTPKYVEIESFSIRSKYIFDHQLLSDGLLLSAVSAAAVASSTTNHNASSNRTNSSNNNLSSLINGGDGSKTNANSSSSSNNNSRRKNTNNNKDQSYVLNRPAKVALFSSLTTTGPSAANSSNNNYKHGMKNGGEYSMSNNGFDVNEVIQRQHGNGYATRNNNNNNVRQNKRMFNSSHVSENFSNKRRVIN